MHTQTHPCPSSTPASSPLKKLLTLNTTSQSPHIRNPQSNFNINSRVALQHIRFQPDKSFQFRQVTSTRYSAQRRRAAPASERMSAHPKHISDLPPKPHPPPYKTILKLNTTTQRSHNRNPQSKWSNNSLVALQHIRFRKNKSFHARQATTKRCNVQGRHAVPAGARMSAHPNTSLPSPLSCILSPQEHSQHSTPNHKAPTTATLNQTSTLTNVLHCSTSAFARIRASTQGR